MLPHCILYIIDKIVLHGMPVKHIKLYDKCYSFLFYIERSYVAVTTDTFTVCNLCFSKIFVVLVGNYSNRTILC